MSLDIYLEARIKEKSGRIISSDIDQKYYDEEDEGFFEICSWHSRLFCDVRTRLIEISNTYAGMHYTDSDFAIPVPQKALRGMYEYLIERACLHEGEIFEVLQGGSEWKWIEKGSYEKMNLCNAEKLHDLIWNLNLIQYENTILLDGIYIPDKRDLALLEKNPAAYDWEFRICNSY